MEAEVASLACAQRTLSGCGGYVITAVARPCVSACDTPTVHGQSATCIVLNMIGPFHAWLHLHSTSPAPVAQPHARVAALPLAHTQYVRLGILYVSVPSFTWSYVKFGSELKISNHVIGRVMREDRIGDALIMRSQNSNWDGAGRRPDSAIGVGRFSHSRRASHARARSRSAVARGCPHGTPLVARPRGGRTHDSERETRQHGDARTHTNAQRTQP